mmetsp:Transcript_30311/g.58920  ORF Transcript_30311/g.58920 Transcript_30311/m.58920 type:complete len:283 (+) Transcript_30311:682-1530(+)
MAKGTLVVSMVEEEQVRKSWLWLWLWLIAFQTIFHFLCILITFSIGLFSIVLMIVMIVVVIGIAIVVTIVVTIIIVVIVIRLHGTNRSLQLLRMGFQKRQCRGRWSDGRTVVLLAWFHFHKRRRGRTTMSGGTRGAMERKSRFLGGGGGRRRRGGVVVCRLCFFRFGTIGFGWRRSFGGGIDNDSGGGGVDIGWSVISSSFSFFFDFHGRFSDSSLGFSGFSVFSGQLDGILFFFFFFFFFLWCFLVFRFVFVFSGVVVRLPPRRLFPFRFLFSIAFPFRVS